MTSLPQPVMSWYLFCLGLAVGVTILAMTSYLSVSPRWLRWGLLACGLLVESRYLTMALFATSPEPQRLWPLRACWYASTIGLALPAAVALDQLVRHPAMTPKRLLRWCSPFLLAYAAILLLGRYELVVDPLMSSRPKLAGWWLRSLGLVEGLFLAGFAWLSVRLFRKLPLRPIRAALALLMAAYGPLGIIGLLVALGRWSAQSFLFAELAALCALWFAFETARTNFASQNLC